jgi:thiamine biosynthesis lipoprotein
MRRASNRTNFVTIAVSVVTALCTLLLSGCDEPAHRREPLSAMGDEGFIDLYFVNEKDLTAAFEETRAAIARIDVMTDANNPDGGLAQLNREAAQGYFEVTDRDLYRVVRTAMDYARTSRGAFDPTVGPLMRVHASDPSEVQIQAALEAVGWRWVAEAQEASAIRFRRPGMALDLGAIRKGFALHVASRSLARTGSRAGLFVLGGNAFAWGAPPGERFWTVPIADPRRPGQALLSVQVENRGVSLARGVELLDAESGYPVETDIVMAIGITHTAAGADAFATSMAASSYDAATDLIGRMRQVEAVLLVRQQGRLFLLASASLKGRLQLSPELEAEIGGDIRYLLPPLEYPNAPA